MLSLIERNVLNMQYNLYIINFNPTIGVEINKTRPAIIISPNEMNKNLDTVIVAPITKTIKTNYPTRIKIDDVVQCGCEGFIVLDQIRTIDKARFKKNIGTASDKMIREIKTILKEMLIY
jgi:mRNA interferase MazF